ncbi:MAG: prepilin-type N-terminal cleavage/methylation domain-containing protein [Vicinamibacteria bacterium]
MTSPAPTPSIVSTRAGRASGFSLLELMVAMTITLIITGAMYGFITQTGNAFSREPALADRQQQIRLSMDRIQQDILVGGSNLGRYFQAFTPGLDAAGTFVGVTAGQNTDILETWIQQPDCPAIRLCVATPPLPDYSTSQDCKFSPAPTDPATGALKFVDAVQGCYPAPGHVALLYGDGNAKVGWGNSAPSPGGGVGIKFIVPGQPAGTQLDDGETDFLCSVPTGTGLPVCPSSNSCVGTPASCPYAIAPVDAVRYQIALDTDGVPGLFRSTRGGLTGVVNAAPTTVAPPGANWQLIGRGIEDMQIRYRTRDGAAVGTDFWSTTPPVVGILPDNIVREVEVTLWARAVGIGTNVAGQTTAANGVTAVRGSMTMRVTPRAALDALVNAATNPWH